jgi:outer membrane protein assembly factor BamA
MRFCVALCVLLISTNAAADVRDYVGHLLVDVRVEVGGAPYADPAVLQLIETRVGERLSMAEVRESVDHLVGLGRFEDVRVFAERAAAAADGVTLRWVLVPVQRIAFIDIDGDAEISADTLRDEVAEQVGALPVTSEVGEVLRVLRAYYAQRGYRQPAIEPRIVEGDAPERAELNLRVDSGPRSRIERVEVRGDAGQPDTAVLSELGIEAGDPYDRPALDARLESFANSLRDLGYYEATVEATETFNDQAATVDLVVDVERGPRVRVVFAGDPLPENRRDTLVPIRQERSVDLDLLEDTSRNIESYLREQGYRAAEAPYVRAEKGGEMVLTFTISRGPLHRLRSIEVVGNAELSAGAIAPLLALETGEPFSESRVATVASAVTELYRVRGFATATVKPDIAVLPPTREAGQEVRPVAVTLIVTEGPRITVGRTDVAGNDAVADEQILSLVGLTTGRPYYRPQLDADRDAIERYYRNQGYRNIRADVETTLAADGQRLDILWSVTEGARTLIDRVLVSGNTRTSGELIRRTVTLQPGSPLGEDALIESQRQLAELGLFRRVRIVELHHTGAPTRDVLIEVEESPTTTIDYGGGVEAGRRLRTGEDEQAEERIDIAPRGFLQISRRNLWGKNRSLTFFTRVSLRPRDPGTDADPSDTGGYGLNDYRVVGTFREPRVLGRPGDLQLTGFLEQAIRSSFNFTRRGVRADFGRRFGSALTVSGRYSLDHTKLFDIHIAPEDQLLIDRLFPQLRLSTLTAAIMRDTRNDVIDPERGTLSGVETTFSFRRLGSEVGFAKTSLQGFVFRRLPGPQGFTLAAGARLGLAVGFTRLLETDVVVDDVPASERFFAGGDSTVRGFVLDRLGTPETLNEQGFPEGGSGLVVLNAELRTAYWKGLGGVGFVDAGNVFPQAGDIDLTELRPAAGFGVRYRSPLGPLRFDLGFNLNPELLPTGERERRMVFHLSLGQAF